MNYRDHQKQRWDSLALEHGEVQPLRAVISQDDLVNYYFDKTSKRLLARTIRPQSTWSVLDIGCGVGRLSMWLASQTENVVGVDISETMIDVATTQATSAGIHNVESLRTGQSRPLTKAGPDHGTPTP